MSLQLPQRSISTDLSMSPSVIRAMESVKPKSWPLDLELAKIKACSYWLGTIPQPIVSNYSWVSDQMHFLAVFLWTFSAFKLSILYIFLLQKLYLALNSSHINQAYCNEGHFVMSQLKAFLCGHYLTSLYSFTENGKLYTQIHIGLTEKTIVTGEGLGDDLWHSVKLERRGMVVTLAIDDDRPLIGTIFSFHKSAFPCPIPTRHFCKLHWYKKSGLNDFLTLWKADRRSIDWFQIVFSADISIY